MIARPGWGTRHPAVTDLMAVCTPAAVAERVVWRAGVIELRIAAHLGLPDLPDDVVTSVRVVVRVDGDVVVCHDAGGGRGLMPGGRREVGESFADTACREVHEETGWLLDRSTIRPLGWLHLEHHLPRLEEHAEVFPYPDFLQVVLTADAAERDGGRNVAWTDTEGWELSSSLVGVDEALALFADDAVSTVFLRAALSA